MSESTLLILRTYSGDPNWFDTLNHIHCSMNEQCMHDIPTTTINCVKYFIGGNFKQINSLVLKKIISVRGIILRLARESTLEV